MAPYQTRGHGSTSVQSVQVRFLEDRKQNDKMVCGPLGAKKGDPANSLMWLLQMLFQN